MANSIDNQPKGCACSHDHDRDHNDEHGHNHEHNHGSGNNLKEYVPSIISFMLLAIGLFVENVLPDIDINPHIRFTWYGIAYLCVGYPVLKEAFEAIINKDFFNEFTLMGIATIGAFCIGEYPEGVAVMLFYSIGEIFQSSAVNKAKRNIKALLDIRPDKASVKRNGEYITVAPQDVNIGETIQVKAGEKVPLDGQLISDVSSFNTVALSGESKPSTIRKGETVLAGMVNLNKVVEIEVEKAYSDSSLAKILAMVQDATSRKAKTELLITRFARIYTPIVFFLALAITLIPYLFVQNYIFSEWLYRGLVFLVISCPCALVISIPLGYFGGIGAASRYGILFKGANYIDVMCDVNVLVMDKTGTLTKGVFEVQQIESVLLDESKFLSIVKALEQYSNHPIAKAILNHAKNEGYKTLEVSDVEEISGHGLKGLIDNQSVIIGNGKLMKNLDIDYNPSIDDIPNTTVLVAIDQVYAGYIIIADEIKEDAKEAITNIHKQGITKTVMLSGDKTSIVNSVGRELGVDEAYGDLLPEDKVYKIEQIKTDKSNVVAFVGDGINDAPVLALSDVGIAMGGMGADAAIESADVIIQTDQPSKIATAIRISRSTKTIVIQNIILAFTIKILVLILGGMGIATMWEAVFADVGVTLLAVLNAVRILRKKF